MSNKTVSRLDPFSVPEPGSYKGEGSDIAVSHQAAEDENVGTLKRRAQVALGIGTARLLDSSGSVVEGCVPIKKSRVQNGDSLNKISNARQRK